MALNWRKLTFGEIKKQISENQKFSETIKSFHYLPSIFAYGISLILLLKLSQVILGWHF